MDDLVAFCNSTKVIGVDLETTSLDCHTGKIILLLSIGNMDTQYVVDVTTVSMEPLREILANKPKVLHNGKFDYKFFKKLVLNLVISWTLCCFIKYLLMEWINLHLLVI